MNETIDIIQSRASVRAFDPRPLEPEHEAAILRAALRAPTAGNLMLYTILKIKDKKTRSVLAETCDNQPFIAQAPMALIFLADFTRWDRLYRAAGVPELSKENGHEWTGPSLGDFLLCCCDAVTAAENAVIAAQALGVGSCYIGDIMERYETHRELLRLPPRAFPIAMLSLGYPKDSRMPSPRQRFEEKYIVHDEFYRDYSDQELMDMVKKPDEGNGPLGRIRAQFLRKQGQEFAREMARSAKVALEAFLTGNDH